MPNTCNITREVYNATSIVNIMRTYKNRVFLAMVLLDDIPVVQIV